GTTRSKYDKAIAAAKKMEKEGKAHNKYFPATHALTDFAGRYFNPGYGTLRVYSLHDSLFADAVNYTLWLKHYSYDSFDIFIKNKSTGIDTTASLIKIQFQMNTAGDIESLSGVFEGALKPIVFTKGLEGQAIDAKDLQKYIGDYDLAGTTVKIYTKGAKTLYALVPGQPEYELVPLGKDKFGLKVLTGYYLQFELNPTGKATGAIFMQPNGNFKAVKK
ncbi:MAG: DUF3471 domain-containing protein, partial [Janthinobacterium lividum]